MSDLEPVKMPLWSTLHWIWQWLLRPSLKWCLHVLSGHSEIERIVYREQKSRVEALKSLEWSLRRSRSPSLRDLLCCPVEAVSSAVYVIVKQKCVPKNDLPVFQPRLTQALSQVLGYGQLVKSVEWLRQIPYNSQNQEHEEILLKLWSSIKPHTPLENRISKEWQEIGFQGSDPATDFRGMGILGLVQLLYFVENHGPIAQRIFSRSLHPKQGYPFAIAGINLTKLLRDLLREGHLKSHMYNVTKGPADMLQFHAAYCSIFYLFDELWHKGDPPDVMAFNLVTNKLKMQLESFLSSDSAVLPLCPSYDDY